MCQPLFNKVIQNLFLGKAQLLLSLLFLVWLSPSHGLESDKYQPIDVAADSAILDDKAGKAVYRGNVVLTQGTLRITADQLTILADSEGKVESVLAIGNLANFVHVPRENDEPIEAQAITVEYFITEEKIVLTEKARVVQNENLFEGNIIEYDINSEKLQAHGKTLSNQQQGEAPENGRVKMILQPRTKAKPNTPVNGSPEEPSAQVGEPSARNGEPSAQDEVPAAGDEMPSDQDTAPAANHEAKQTMTTKPPITSNP